MWQACNIFLEYHYQQLVICSHAYLFDKTVVMEFAVAL